MGDQPAAKSPEAVSPPSPTMLEGGGPLDDKIYEYSLVSSRTALPKTLNDIFLTETPSSAPRSSFKTFTKEELYKDTTSVSWDQTDENKRKDPVYPAPKPKTPKQSPVVSMEFMNRSKAVGMEFMPKHETPPEQTGAISGLEFAQPEEFSKRTTERIGYGAEKSDTTPLSSLHRTSAAAAAAGDEFSLNRASSGATSEEYEKKYTKFSKNALPYDFPPEFSEPPPEAYSRRHHQQSMAERSRKRYQEQRERDHHYAYRYERDPHRDPRVYNEERLRYEDELRLRKAYEERMYRDRERRERAAQQYYSERGARYGMERGYHGHVPDEHIQARYLDRRSREDRYRDPKYTQRFEEYSRRRGPPRYMEDMYDNEMRRAYYAEREHFSRKEVERQYSHGSHRGHYEEGYEDPRYRMLQIAKSESQRVSSRHRYEQTHI